MQKGDGTFNTSKKKKSEKFHAQNMSVIYKFSVFLQCSVKVKTAVMEGLVQAMMMEQKFVDVLKALKEISVTMVR